MKRTYRTQTTKRYAGPHATKNDEIVSLFRLWGIIGRLKHDQRSAINSALLEITDDSDEQIKALKDEI